MPLPLGPRTLVMGVLNVTPDSFSDGGRSAAPQDALKHARAMREEGADILDIGGESTRPGHTPLGADEEWARIAPRSSRGWRTGPTRRRSLRRYLEGERRAQGARGRCFHRQ